MENEKNLSPNNALDQYLHNLDALRETLDPTMMLTHAAREFASKTFMAELNRVGKVEEDDEGNKKYLIPAAQSREVEKIRRKHGRSVSACELLPRKFLVSFVSEYDAFLGRLMTCLFRICPDALNAKDTQFSFSELSCFDSISEARRVVIERQVETVLRSSHAAQFEWLERTFSTKLREGLESWPQFIELTERRNLFVHNEGKVSSHYLKICSSVGVDVGELSFGDKLNADRAYLIDSYKCLYEIGFKLTHVLWRKLQKEKLEQSDSHLISTSYNLLSDDKLDLATRILDFSVNTVKKHASESNRLTMVVNFAQALKFSGRTRESLELIESVDWSAKSDNFKVCVSVLKDDFNSAAETLVRIGKSGQINENDYLEWPVFKRFRETDEFRTAFRSTFGKEPESVQSHKPSEDNKSQDGSDSNVGPEDWNRFAAAFEGWFKEDVQEDE